MKFQLSFKHGGMRAYSLGLLALLFQVSRGFQSPWEFLAAFEKDKLDWIDYTAVLIENPDDFEVQFNSSTYYFLFGDPDDENLSHEYLKLVKWNLSERLIDNDDCNQVKGKFIKDPLLSYVILDESFDEHLSSFKAFPCILPHQPYFYILTFDEAFYQLYEVQVYSHNILMIGSSPNDSTIIEHSHLDVFKRRSDFKQTSLTLKTVRTEWIDAYNLGIYEMFEDEFNFSPIFEDIEYGTLQNGSWTGSMGKMISLEHDLGWQPFQYLFVVCIQFQRIFSFQLQGISHLQMKG